MVRMWQGTDEQCSELVALMTRVVKGGQAEEATPASDPS
jgi:hypothetical protein